MAGPILPFKKPKIKKPKPKKKFRPSPTALPFNLQFAQQRRNLLANRQDYNRQYRQTVQTGNRDVQNQLRAIGIEEPNVYRSVLNNFAGRGMAYSSGYGTTLGNAANSIANERSAIQQDWQDKLSRLQGDKQNYLNNYQYNLSNILQRQASATEPMAGGLGYNRPVKKKVKKGKGHK